ncbi:hypothetical protein D3C86_2050650 [compost metagenome]
MSPISSARPAKGISADESPPERFFMASVMRLIGFATPLIAKMTEPTAMAAASVTRQIVSIRMLL